MSAFDAFMSGGGWILFSVLMAMSGAGVFLVNQYMQQSGEHLVFWTRVGSILVLLPVFAHIDWPVDPMFYMISILTGLLAGPADMRLYNIIARHGGGVVSRLKPLAVWGAFFLWFAFDPGLFFDYMDRPVNTAIILSAMAGVVFFASRQSRCSISKAALKEYLWPLAAYILTIVLSKYVLGLGDLNGAVFGYIFLQSATIIVLLGTKLAFQHHKSKTLASNWRSISMMKAAFMLTLFWTAAMIFRNYGFAYVPNPSYIGAIGLTTPVFISIFYFLTHHREEAEVKAGMGIVACAVILALATI